MHVSDVMSSPDEIKAIQELDQPKDLEEGNSHLPVNDLIKLKRGAGLAQW